MSVAFLIIENLRPDTDISDELGSEKRWPKIRLLELNDLTIVDDLKLWRQATAA